LWEVDDDFEDGSDLAAFGTWPDPIESDIDDVGNMALTSLPRAIFSKLLLDPEILIPTA
jgi:hypothetical protein